MKFIKIRRKDKEFWFWFGRNRKEHLSKYRLDEIIYYNLLFYIPNSDGWDPFNPLALKSNRSVTTYYMSILNLDDHQRSQRNGIMTVQAVSKHQLQEFKITACLGRLVKDISELVKTGLQLPNNQKCAVRLVQYR